jgi:hypothetical protein
MSSIKKDETTLDLLILEEEKCLLVTPLPRYVADGFCLNPDHCSKRRYPDFMRQTLHGLETLRKNCQDLLYFSWFETSKKCWIRVWTMDIRGLDYGDACGEGRIRFISQQVVYCKTV